MAISQAVCTSFKKNYWKEPTILGLLVQETRLKWLYTLLLLV